MLQVVGAIVFTALAYAALMVTAEHLSPAWRAGATFLIPLIGLAGAAWAVAPKRHKR